LLRDWWNLPGVYVWRWRLVTVWIVAFSVLIGWTVRELSQQGRETRQVAAHARAISVQTRDLAVANRQLVKQLRQLAIEGRQAHDGLCAQKHGYERQLKAARDYLRENPNGAPGIPASAIRNSIRSQEATLKSLKPFHCA
jgi:predicted negative regulator of RcsB-dependent stress response